MKTSISILILTFLLISCGGGEHTEHASGDSTQATSVSAGMASTVEFQSSFREQLERYFELSDALVASNTQKAAEKAATFAESFPNTNTRGLADESSKVWTELSSNILERAENITNLTDIEDQRYQFEYLSENIIGIVTNLGVEGVVYHQRCPMVRGGSGDWLSKEERISNPYHGDRMLRCGTVVAVIE